MNIQTRAILFLSFAANVLVTTASDVVINPGRTSFDTQASVVTLPDGGSWAIWKAYYKSKERVFVRRTDDAAPANERRIVELTDQPTIVDQPRLAASANGKHLWALWSERDNGTWLIKGRRRLDGKWLPTEVVSDVQADGIKPSAVVLNDGQAVFAWHSLTKNRPAQIMLRRFSEKGWTNIEIPSDPAYDSFRVTMVDSGSEIWAFWEQYSDSRRSILGRRILPTPLPIEQVSPLGPVSERNMKPVPLASKSMGLCIAWLKLTDVIGGDGVIDMIHTAHVSARRNGKWEMIKNADGNPDGAAMLNGLLPDLRPKKGYPSGYIGRRRHPMLVDSPDGPWLIWERKSIHGGGGTKTKGQLLGRPIRDGQWGDTTLLYDKLIDYQVGTPERIENGELVVTGSQLPRGWMRPYHRVGIDLSAAKPFSGDDWRDQFKVIDLPNAPHPQRHFITVDGKKYNLYWADLHCHSGLTGDAEGEPDEIILYGRDRAKLDVMVLQDNDDVHGCLLTEGEYYLGMLHSQRYTKPGKFLAFPGYEWTQRKAGSAKNFDPWKSVYEQPLRGTYPNHRTVIYPSTGGPIVRYTEVGGDFKKLTDAVEKAGGIVNSQHQTFDITDSPAEANMEVTSCWGIYIRQVPKKFHGELDSGRRLGFVGCSDSHRRNPGLCGGLTGIYAEELTDAAILRALREHRCFASNGSKIVVDSRANGMLTDRPVVLNSPTLTLDLHLIGTKNIVSATLVTNGGKRLKIYPGNGSPDFRVTHRETGLKPGKHWFYWEVEQEGKSTQYTGNISVAQGHFAWSSPHFVTVK